MRRNNTTSITIADVAEMAGVSIATVSRYINNSGPVSDRVGVRIDDVMKELKYVPNAAAQQLASQKTNVIGLLIKNIHNDFFGPLLLGIESSVRNSGYNLLVAVQHENILSPMPNSIGPHNTDGILVFADSLSEEELIRLHQKKFPMVLIHRNPPPGTSIPSVTVENKTATFEIVSHLIDHHKRKRILFLQGADNQEDSSRRETGYRAALEAHGLKFDPELVLPGGFEQQVAYAAVNNFLQKPDHPTFDGIFTGDDDAAFGVLSALHENGIQVPEEVSVAGFDDSRLSAFMTPSLTTVRAPTKLVGQKAVQQLIRILNNQPVDNQILLPTEIVIRNSCGCHN